MQERFVLVFEKFNILDNCVESELLNFLSDRWGQILFKFLLLLNIGVILVLVF